MRTSSGSSEGHQTTKKTKTSNSTSKSQNFPSCTCGFEIRAVSLQKFANIVSLTSFQCNQTYAGPPPAARFRRTKCAKNRHIMRVGPIATPLNGWLLTLLVFVARFAPALSWLFRPARDQHSEVKSNARVSEILRIPALTSEE